ncbi:MAG: S8 family serine peptidase [Thermoleophilaceae bacterium]|nr:S8 family serine peptidase [Thermoleophilaceae bacterium]
MTAQSAGAAGQIRGFDDPAGSYSASSVVVGFDAETSATAGSAAIAAADAGAVKPGGPRSAVVKIGRSESLASAARKLAAEPGVAWVKPNYLLRTSAYEDWTPDDPGRGTTPGGWQSAQWNFVGQYGIDVLPAWRQLRSLKRSGGRGAIVAIIDTGVAFENYRGYRRSPDLRGVKVKGAYDFIDRDRHPEDRNGHGTHVASTVFEQTDNAVAVTGVAYGATMMPIRALNARGLGDEMTVSRAIRYAADRKADVINLSVEFDVQLSASDLPGIISAMRYARKRGSLVVAAAGNQEATRVAYPARSGYALSVGATTAGGCLADYSDYGQGLDLVAPGGGGDTFDLDTAVGSTDPKNCSVTNAALPIYQMTFVRSPRSFSLPSNYQGTSMASPHVSGVAALAVASGVIGDDPTPVALQQHLQNTATDLGAPGYDLHYGNGLLNAAAAVGAN